MATPNITDPFAGQVISDCESDTGWSGDTFVDELGIKKQGNQSLTCQMTTNGVNEAIFTPASAVDLTGEHIRCWWQSGLIAYVDTVANDGMEFWIDDGTYNHRWTIGGSDNFPSGWVNLVIYAESTPDNGYNALFDFANVTSMGFTFNTTTKPRGVDNFWVDYLRYGDGLTATGGTAFTAGNFISLDEIAIVDGANGYGIVEKSPVNGVITIFGEVLIGDGATTTYCKEDKTTAVFADVNVEPTLYKFIGQGSGCNIEMLGFNLKAFNQTYTFDMNDADLASLVVSGCAISTADAVYFKAGQSIINTVFDSCGQIDPSTATFTGITISTYVGSTGALLWPTDDTNCNNIAFILCDNDVEYDVNSDGTPSFFNIVHDDNAGDYDVNNTSGSSVTIPLSGTSNGNSYNPGGDLVTFEASVTLTFIVTDEDTEVPIQYARINIVNASTKAELYQIETNVSGIATQSHTYAGDLGIEGWVRQFDIAGDDYASKDFSGTIRSTGFDANIVLTKI